MAVYDLAHKLGEQLKKSEEYQEYQNYRQELLKDEETKKMVDDYQNISFRVNSAKAWGQEVKEEDQKKLEKLEELVQLNIRARKYLEAETRMSIILQDIQKIIFEDLELGLFQEKEEEDG